MRKTFMSDLQVDKAVAIQGTEFDRKRKLTNKDVRRAKLMRKSGATLTAIASTFKVDPRTIQYNIDDTYRTNILLKASGKHSGNQVHTFADRVAYKRSIISK